MNKKTFIQLLLPTFFLVFTQACHQKIPKSGTEHSDTYKIKIYPKYKYINDGLIPKRACIEGEVNGKTKLFCQGIEGFTYEEGFDYVLKVKEEKLENVPADFSADRIYKLVKVVSKVPVSEQHKNASLNKISIETTFDAQKTNSSGYQYIFSINENGNGFGKRVVTYENINDWITDTKKQITYSKDIKGEDYIVQTLSERILKKVDFSKENLIIVYHHTGGPPFGELKNELKGTLYEFFVEEPKVQIRGAALKIFFEFYKTPKPFKAVLKK